VTGMYLIKTTVANVIPSVKDVTLILNGKTNQRFSLEQTILIKKNDIYYFGTTGILEIGDVMVERQEDGSFLEIPVTDITIIDEQRTVYQFDADPVDTLIAGGLVVHNSKRFA